MLGVIQLFVSFSYKQEHLEPTQRISRVFSEFFMQKNWMAPRIKMMGGHDKVEYWACFFTSTQWAQNIF